jgi:hypothetical protein
VGRQNHRMLPLEKAIAAEKGDFILFVLIQRAEGIGLWDLVLSASWLSIDEKENLDYIAKKLTENLTPEELMLISQIRPFPPTDPRVQEILQLVQRRLAQPVNHGHVELSSWTLSSMPVSHAHIITAASSHQSPSASLTFSQSTPAPGDTSTRSISPS